MNITTYIPATWRKPLYGVFAVVAVALGAVQVGIAATDAGNPVWLNVALAVFPFIATAVGFTAASNTTAQVDGEGWDARLDGSMADYATADDAVEMEDN